jgi:hypothetical protein
MERAKPLIIGTLLLQAADHLIFICQHSAKPFFKPHPLSLSHSHHLHLPPSLLGIVTSSATITMKFSSSLAVALASSSCYAALDTRK